MSAKEMFKELGYKLDNETKGEELKKEINKAEYEKAREPLNNEIRELNGEIWELRKQIEAYRQVFSDIVCSLDYDCIKLYIRKNPVEVQFGKMSDIKLMQDDLKPVNVPIKDMLRCEINRKVTEMYYKIKGEEK